jgi:hypothetical protein
LVRRPLDLGKPLHEAGHELDRGLGHPSEVVCSEIASMAGFESRIREPLRTSTVLNPKNNRDFWGGVMLEIEVVLRVHAVAVRITLPIVMFLLVSFPTPSATAQDPARLYENVTDTHLPVLDGPSMDAGLADLDGDGDLDVVVAVEWERNRVLINNGHGVFSDESESRLPFSAFDSEDVGIVDVDGDGDLDLVFVSEENQENELFLNNGNGIFTRAGERLGSAWGVSNALHVADVDVDGSPDLVIGNAGFNWLLMNDGQGWFHHAPDRLPWRGSSTEDVELADIDRDGDLDILDAGESDNRIVINIGDGFFEHTDGWIEFRNSPEETREADLADVDCDGDLDIYFANVHLSVEGSDPRDRLVINNGLGRFTDETEARIPADDLDTWEVDFIDVDCDGDLDIITGNGELEYRPTWPTSRLIREEPFLVLLNDGDGFFTDATEQVFPDGIQGYGWDVAAGDVDGDGAVDLYLASRFTRDFLLLSTAEGPCEIQPCQPPGPRRSGRRVTP